MRTPSCDANESKGQDKRATVLRELLPRSRAPLPTHKPSRRTGLPCQWPLAVTTEEEEEEEEEDMGGSKPRGLAPGFQSMK